jgi:NAD(P)-dependent dehydrogenase (short-subunit alcohol dehydrogenase family)
VGMRFRGKRCVVTGEGPIADATVARLTSEGATVARTLDELAGLDVLVTAYAVREDRPFLELEDDVWERTLDGNLTSAFVNARAAARLMLAAGGGVIVHVGSAVAVRPVPGSAAYAAAKAGVHLLATATALDLIPDGIRVCCVAAGEGGRTSPADVAASVAFCASDDASYVIGSTFFVEGPLPHRG